MRIKLNSNGKISAKVETFDVTMKEHIYFSSRYYVSFPVLIYFLEKYICISINLYYFTFPLAPLFLQMTSNITTRD